MVFLLSSATTVQLSNLSAPVNFAAVKNQSASYSWSMYLHDQKHTGFLESSVPKVPTILWNYTIGGSSWGPVVANGRVYIGSFDGKVYSLDQASEAKIWEFSTGVVIGSSPTVDDGMVFIGSTDGKVYALDESNGTKIWEFSTGKAILSS